MPNQTLINSYERQLLNAGVSPQTAAQAARDLARGQSTPVVKQAYQQVTGQGW
jgi:hypothetical protein